LCALCIDADHFKAVNDTHGHDAGDRVLVDIAARLQQAVRRYDMVARVGGEEFTVLLIGIGAEEGACLAERIRGAIADSPCGGIPVTASVGVAAWRPGDTPDALLKRADEALYAAKGAGRNRVVAVPG
jgi:diguanylate cyclase (GGDEF)-like protein